MVLHAKSRPTKRAPDAGALRVARFQAFFHASAFFQSDGVPPPAPARVPREEHAGRAANRWADNNGKRE
jgi:hypothetical protein